MAPTALLSPSSATSGKVCVPQDYVEAARLYRQAAAQDFAPALRSLATLYAEGKGMARDPADCGGRAAARAGAAAQGITQRHKLFPHALSHTLGLAASPTSGSTAGRKTSSRPRDSKIHPRVHHLEFIIVIRKQRRTTVFCMSSSGEWAQRVDPSMVRGVGGLAAARSRASRGAGARTGSTSTSRQIVLLPPRLPSP